MGAQVWLQVSNINSISQLVHFWHMALPMKKMKTATTRKPMKRTMKKQVSVVARGKRAKSSVFRGTKAKTAGGLTRDGLMRNKYCRIVSKKASAAAKKRAATSGFAAWTKAVGQACKELGLK